MQIWESHYRLRAAQQSEMVQSGRSEQYPVARLLRTIHDVAQLLRLGPDDHLLDAGCGNGLLSMGLAWFCGQLTAVEPVAELCALARRNLDGTENATIHHARADAIPLPDATCQCIVMHGVLQLLDEAEVAATLRELRRVAAPGARVLLGNIPDATDREAHIARIRALDASEDQRETGVILSEAANWYEPVALGKLWVAACGPALFQLRRYRDGCDRFDLLITLPGPG